MDEELKRQRAIILALEEEITLQKNAAIQDEDSAAAQKKAKEDLIKANTEVNKIQSQINQLRKEDDDKTVTY